MTTQRGSAGSRPIAVAVAAGAAGAALALGALWAAGQITTPAGAQDPPSAGGGTFKVTPAQLKINQRISQAAVRRSNESLSLLDPIRPMSNQPTKVLGWKTATIADGAITGPKLADGAVGETALSPAVAERLPLWALVNPAGGLVRQRGATNSQNLAAGLYRVTFGRDVSACSYTATLNAAFGMVGVNNDGANPNAVLVATSNNTGVATNRAFTVQVLC